ncbi:aminomethyl-transferring glycine dehydrogenase subunit GcvPA [Liberiplasma polymorphum]|uniref:aminomethyl-transferring glycine dehydrogenase subunit GcvPA n=1 Tax=Liberiplasma polymorphum TaxID=3374570 RepID=UPI003772DF2D
MFKYLPHTHEDIKAMLETIGVKNIDALFADIPKELVHKDLDLPSSMSELEIYDHFEMLASMNKPLISFMGAGAYDHYTPSVIRHIIERQEFLTAYTPYQPEISQGTLQYIFEYQSMITQLTGMDVSNASMYDGATATAEAMFMACSHRKKNKILISATVNPNIIEVVKTYALYKGIEVTLIEEHAGETSLDHLKAIMNDSFAGVIVQTPNVYGIIENLDGFKETIEEHKGLFIINQDPSTLSHLKTPRTWGADIAVGEAQTLGIPLSYGGPYIGYMATLEKYMRKMPGRICGVTKDTDGKRAFVLTLQAREQHIRREKANSNICSNQSLLALFVTVYMSIMGKKGLYEVQQRSYDNAHYLHTMLLKLPTFSEVYDKPFFKEFTLRTSLDPNHLNSILAENGYLGPLPFKMFNEEKSDLVVFALTEKRTKTQIDDLIRIIGGLS